MFSDRKMQCIECAAEFTFTAADQERHAQRGFRNEPKRCAPCRAARKVAAQGARSGFAPRPARENHPAICGKCGKPTTLPFKPRGDRPVLCSDCFGPKR